MTQASSLSPLQSIHDAIAQTCLRAGRKPTDVCLIAVSKTKPQEAVRDFLNQGHRHFGENKVQEATEKFSELREQYEDLCLHLIGPLQTNKVRDAVRISDAIHSVDRPKLVRAIAKERENQGRCPKLFVQVNIGEEPQKAGVSPSALTDILAQMNDCELPIEGLMCIPPANTPAAGHFSFLRSLAERHNIKGLSMGMSADFKAAVELGATHIRIGSTLFGARASAISKENES